MNGKSFLVAALSLSSMNAGAAVAYTVDDVPTAFVSNEVIDQSIGIDFTIGATPVVVSSLGYFDYGADGLESLSNVAIFEDLGVGGIVKLGEVSVFGTAGSSMDGNFRFVDLASPIVLNAGSAYRVVGNTGNNGGNSNSLPFTGGPAINITTDPAVASVGPDYQATSTPNGTVVHPFFELNVAGVFELPLVNIKYDAIPEPSSTLLIGLASLGFCVRRRR